MLRGLHGYFPSGRTFGLIGGGGMYEWGMPEVCPHVHTWRPCYPSLPSGELLTAF